MRHTCQVYVGAVQCGKPAVDCVEVDSAGAHLAKFAPGKDPLRTSVWMCAEHLDDWMKEKNEP